MCTMNAKEFVRDHMPKSEWADFAETVPDADQEKAKRLIKMIDTYLNVQNLRGLDVYDHHVYLWANDSLISDGWNKLFKSLDVTPANSEYILADAMSIQKNLLVELRMDENDYNDTFWDVYMVQPLWIDYNNIAEAQRPPLFADYIAAINFTFPQT